MPDVEIDILANDKTSRGTTSAAKNFSDLDKHTKRVTKQIESLPLGQIGGKAANGFISGFTKNLAGLSGQAAPYIAGVGVAAAPLLGATLAGAIIGGAGIGGVVGGLIVASRDTRVQGAADALGERFESRLEQAAGSFVQPAIDGIGRIEYALDSIDIEGIFRDSSRFVMPLADGVGHAIESLGDGIESLVRNAGPAVDAIADGIAGIGETVGDGLASLADNGESAADALRVTFAIINASIAPTLQAVNALTELYEINRAIGGDIGLRTALKLMGQDLGTVGENGRIAGSGTFGAAEGIQAAGESADRAAPPIKSVAEQMSDAANAATDLFDSATDVGGALDRASKAAKDNGKTLSANTEKGRENRQALTGVAKALRSNYEQYVAVNGAGAKAEGVAEANRAAFLRTARQFGVTAGKAEELADQILGIPQKRKTDANFAAGQAKKDITNYKNSIDSIPRYRRTTVEIAARITGSSASRSALQSALNKQSLKFDSMASFTPAAGGSTSRTGGATPVEVNSNIEVTVTPDLSEVRAGWRADLRREQFRTKVGQSWQ